MEIKPVGEWCDAPGSRRLKEKIEEYWRVRGYAVDITLPEAGFHAGMRSKRFDLRSDMVDGLPRMAKKESR